MGRDRKRDETKKNRICDVSMAARKERERNGMRQERYAKEAA